MLKFKFIKPNVREWDLGESMVTNENSQGRKQLLVKYNMENVHSRTFAVILKYLSPHLLPLF